MKELSIEEKAKAYDEKIKKAQKWYDANTNEGYRGIFEDIFPELVESENERIGKEIISYLKRRIKMDSSIPAAIDYWINWLEKQVEHAKFRDSIQIGDQVTKNQDGILVNLSQLKRFAKPAESKKHNVCNNCDQQGGCVSPCPMKLVEKQAEQKPNYCHHEVDLSNCSEEYRKAYYDGWNNCNMQHSQCKSELDDVVKCLINGMKFYYGDSEEVTWGTDKWSMPVEHIIEVLEKYDKQQDVNIQINPSEYINDMGGNGCYLKNTAQTSAWSEEDEKRLSNAITQLKAASNIIVDDEVDDSIAFIKSLKDRVQPQIFVTNEELTQAKKDAYNDALNKIEYHSGEPTFDDGWSAAIWYLKKRNAQPQTTWKPSDEQIRELSIVSTGKGWFSKEILSELLEQLKKLKED